MRKLLCLALLACLCSVGARGQFYVSGSDPASIRWSSVETQHYSVIYPSGLDSLAAVYARCLEQVAVPVGMSLGYTANGMYAKRMPVVLHTRTSFSNGMVTWTPRRVEFLTVPDAYAPEATPWERQLAVHESRHVAQLQFGNEKCFKPFNILLGQLTTGALSGIYPGEVFLEGDAVRAETALTSAGRGRTADFLEHYRVSAAEGEFRSFWQWRYGSMTRFAPDHYAAGYLKIAGTIVSCDVPDLTKGYYERIVDRHGWSIANFPGNLKAQAGVGVNGAFARTWEMLSDAWAADNASRGPFMQGERLTPVADFYDEYVGTTAVPEGLLTVRKGNAASPALVLVRPDSTMMRVRAFASISSSLHHSPVTNLTYWTEYRSDLRWEQQSSSALCCMDSRGLVGTLSSGGRLYNPAPSDTEPVLAVTSYPEEGGSDLLVLDAYDGSVLESVSAPDGMQIVESAWVGGKLYVSAITSGGFGIYGVPSFDVLLAPKPVKIKQLGSREGRLTFVSDRTGVNELYALDPSSGRLDQLSLTRDGASDFAFRGDDLYFSKPALDGRGIWKIPVDSLLWREADWAQVYEYPIAGTIASQEPLKIDYDAPVEISDPRPYRKLAHLFRFHSWAPVYVDYDAVKSLSLETIFTSVGVGATAFWQNTLGSCYGQVGVRALGSDFAFQPSLHAKLTYTGLFPVIEASFALNDREAWVSRYYSHPASDSEIKHEGFGIPRVSGALKVYVPMSLSSGGWSRGIVPQVSVSAANDAFAYIIDRGTKSGVLVRTQGGSTPTGRVTASLRGYSVLPTPSSCLFPRLGIGVEAGISRNLVAAYCPNVYGYVYGYLPGFRENQGFKLTAMVEGKPGDGGIFVEPYVSTVPRGFNSAAQSAMSPYPLQAKLTVDYAIPFANLEWAALSPIIYLRNLELTPHFDWSYFSATKDSGSLISAGASFAFRLGIGKPVHLGVDYSYNAGSLYSKIEEADPKAGHNHFGLVFSVDM